MSGDNLFPHQREIIRIARENARLDVTIAKQAVDRLANGYRLHELMDETAVCLAQVRDYSEHHLAYL